MILVKKKFNLSFSNHLLMAMANIKPNFGLIFNSENLTLIINIFFIEAYIIHLLPNIIIKKSSQKLGFN